METAREQFNKEAQALVQLIKDMYSAGQTAEAGQLLGQYKLLNPTDPQIQELTGIMQEAAQQSGQVSAEKTNIPDFLKNTESVFIVTGLGMKRTGVFTSIFGKVKLMEEQFGYNSTILLCRHDIDLKKTEVWLKTFSGTSSILLPGTKIISIYEYFQKSYIPGLENKAVYAETDTDDKMSYEKLSDKTYAVYDGDTKIRLDVYTGYSGALRVQRFFKGEETEKEVYYDDWGYLNNIRTTDPDNENLVKVQYFTTDEKLCIEAFFDNKKDALDPYKILLYDENEKLIKELKNNHELAAIYFSKVISKEKFYLLIYESGLVSEIAGFLDKSIKNVAMITVIHSIFLKNAYDLKCPPQMYYEYVCNNPEKFDGIVLLTKGARRDFTSLYGQHKNTFVIPHPYPYEIEPVDFEQRDVKKAVVVGRLFPEKQLEVTVDIFSTVVKALPDVKLELYGIGPEEEKIREHIKKLKMEDSIFIMGYTDDPIGIYRTAILSIMTSLAEGYGLAIVESICNGCPVFAHDIKYGPADIIKDGETGFLFPRNDKIKFAQKIIRFFEDEQMQRTMSGNCYADTPRFGQDVFMDRWLGMTEKIIGG